MEKQIDFYFDLVSPYSYIASMLIDDVARRGNAKVSWKPFLLGGVFKAVGTTEAPGLHPAKKPYLLKDKYDSLRRVKHIQAQTIALVAENDEVIPKKHSIRLINEFPPEQITAITINNSGHNDISYKEEYYQHLKDFFNY